MANPRASHLLIGLVLVVVLAAFLGACSIQTAPAPQSVPVTSPDDDDGDDDAAAAPAADVAVQLASLDAASLLPACTSA